MDAPSKDIKIPFALTQGPNISEPPISKALLVSMFYKLKISDSNNYTNTTYLVELGSYFRRSVITSNGAGAGHITASGPSSSTSGI